MTASDDRGAGGRVAAAARTLDLSPDPGAAPRWRAVASQARTETMLLLRNGEQLLLSLVIPVGVLLLGHTLGPRLGLSLDELAPSVLALAIWSTAFTATAIATGFERRYGVLERLAATPLRRSGLVLGKSLAVVAVTAGQVALLLVLALLLGWRPQAPALQWLVVLVTVPLSATCFVSLALAMAGRLRAEATLALANLVHLLVAGGGALLVAAHHYPAAWREVVRYTPTSALGEALRALSGRQPTPFSVPVALVWAAGSVLLARKVFRWTS